MNEAARSVTKRLYEGAYRLGLDRLAFRVWRYNPVSLLRWYRHGQFDRAFDVETRGYSDLRYEPTPADRFKTMLNTLERLALHPEDFVFVDFGSGKGKVVLMAAGYPFRAVIGVEVWPDLHRIAEENLRRFRARRHPAAPIELVLMDAGQYAVPDVPALLYFFNPFGKDVLRQVLSNLERSLASHPRRVVVVFYTTCRRGAPWDRRRLFDEAPFLTRIRDEKTYTVYANA